MERYAFFFLKSLSYRFTTDFDASGYSDAENTWEPESNLDCPDLIQAFEEQRKKNEALKKDEKGKVRKTSGTPTPDSKPKKAKMEEKKQQGTITFQ